MLTTGLVLGAVVMGAGMQRITGMGFALVAAPSWYCSWARWRGSYW